MGSNGYVCIAANSIPAVLAKKRTYNPTVLE